MRPHGDFDLSGGLDAQSAEFLRTELGPTAGGSGFAGQALGAGLDEEFGFCEGGTNGGEAVGAGLRKTDFPGGPFVGAVPETDVRLPALSFKVELGAVEVGLLGSQAEPAAGIREDSFDHGGMFNWGEVATKDFERDRVVASAVNHGVTGDPYIWWNGKKWAV